MPFQYTLANLLAANEGALAVLFLDDSGEVVDLACTEHEPFQMKIVGAYVGIYLRQLSAVFEQAQLGTPKVLHIEKDDVHFYATALPDGYYLVLVQHRPALVARARETLERARREIAREIFAEP
ncbi:MAG: hypothetical protein D6696_21130 [Acidobacteria bacterium]|nr:MAG: hypothetical protein D6696_21130 [Acidobacteriota bacterium]